MKNIFFVFFIISYSAYGQSDSIQSNVVWEKLMAKDCFKAAIILQLAGSGIVAYHHYNGGLENNSSKLILPGIFFASGLVAEYLGFYYTTKQHKSPIILGVSDGGIQIIYKF